MSPVFDPPEPTTIMAVEDAIVARLAATVPGIAVDAFPDDPDKYRLTHQVGALLVRFAGAAHTARADVSSAATDRALLFDVVAQVRGLGRKGQAGVYQYLEAARLSLIGYEIPAFTRLTPVDERFLGQGEGVWTYALRVRTTTLALAVADEDVGPLLARITLDRPPDTLEIP